MRRYTPEMRTPSIFLAILAAGCTADPQPGLQPSNQIVGWAGGDLAPDVRVTDQFGDPFSVSSLAGSLVLVDVTMMWATVGSDVPDQSEAIAQRYAADGLIYVSVITEDVSSDPTTQSDLLWWADEFGVTGPVVGASPLWPEHQGAWLIDPGGSVHGQVQTYTAAGIEFAIVEAL